MPFALPTPTHFLSAPKATSKKIGFRCPSDDLDDILSSDLELSFTSAVSMRSPHQEAMTLSSDAMDISPMPPVCRLNELDEHSVSKLRPRAHTTSARLFGLDLSNSPPTEKGVNQRQTQRNPSEWATTWRPSDLVTVLDVRNSSFFDLRFEADNSTPLVSRKKNRHRPIRIPMMRWMLILHSLRLKSF
jgi:hypothetical protein